LQEAYGVKEMRARRLRAWSSFSLRGPGVLCGGSRAGRTEGSGVRSRTLEAGPQGGQGGQKGRDRDDHIRPGQGRWGARRAGGLRGQTNDLNPSSPSSSDPTPARPSPHPPPPAIPTVKLQPPTSNLQHTTSNLQPSTPDTQPRSAQRWLPTFRPPRTPASKPSPSRWAAVNRAARTGRDGTGWGGLQPKGVAVTPSNLRRWLGGGEEGCQDGGCKGARLGLGWAGPLGRAGPGRAGPGRAGPGRAGPGRAGRRAGPGQRMCTAWVERGHLS
jgi:hypothetical protein